MEKRSTSKTTSLSPVLIAVVNAGMEHIAQMRAMKQAWKATLNTLRRSHGLEAVRMVEEEIDKLQSELDLAILRNRSDFTHQ